jgi:hypothetical protein
LSASVGALEWGKGMHSMLVYRTKAIGSPRNYTKIISIARIIKKQIYFDAILPRAEEFDRVFGTKIASRNHAKMPSLPDIIQNIKPLPKSIWLYQHLLRIGWEPGKGIG